MLEHLILLLFFPASSIKYPQKGRAESNITKSLYFPFFHSVKIFTYGHELTIQSF